MYRRVLDLDPDNLPALSHLAVIERQRGNIESALLLTSRIVESDPKDADSRSNLANLLQELGRLPEALSQYHEALRLEPRHLAARYNLGKVLQRLGKIESALECFEALCALAPDDSGIWAALGLVLQDAGASERALAALRRALDLDPGNAEALNAVGSLHMERGAFSEAETAFVAALQASPRFTPAFVNLVHTRRVSGDDQALVARIEKLAQHGSLPESDRADLHFALGKAQEDLGCYEQAFAHYSAGNRLRRRSINHDRKTAGERAAALVSAFDPDFFTHSAGHGDQSPRPVFVVGMPRSGTSLVEQILASHPECFGAGELPYLGNIAGEIAAGNFGNHGYPAGVRHMSGAQFRALGHSYLAALPAEALRASRVVDKMPANYLHLGLVAAILPRAHIIWCRRAAMDVCFSIYAQQFTHRHAYAYAYDLNDIASEYLAYEQLMAHWKSTLPMPMFEASYEHLVRDERQAIADLLEFCDLSFDARCLRFHETERNVRTASSRQVRQPLYGTSVGRWRRFERHLAPLLAALGTLE